MFLLLLALQAAAAAAPPERFSILVPVAPQACAPRQASKGDDGEVVVCAKDLPDQTVPLPNDHVHPGPRPSNPDLTGAGALAASGPPCATLQGGCQVGFGPPLAPVVKALVGLVKDAVAKKPDKRGRVPIDIGEPTPQPAAKD